MIEKTRAAANLLNTLATMWIFLLAFVILGDVLGRTFFNQPLQGTKEIVANSIAAIVFLQFPLAIHQGALLRSTFILDLMPSVVKRLIDVAAYLLGGALFTAMAVGGWEDMLIGWRIGEIEGEGSFPIPVYPVRTVIVALSGLSAIMFLILIAASFRADPDAKQQEL